MAGVNKVILIGNLGQDPEIRVLESGVKVARLRLATNESYRDQQGVRKEITEWHTVVLWRGLAEIAEKYLHKGSQVYVEGKIQTRNWQDQQGQDRYSTEIVANNLTMLSRRDEGDTANEPDDRQSSYTTAGNSNSPASSGEAKNANLQNEGDFGDEDDLPF